MEFVLSGAGLKINEPSDRAERKSVFYGLSGSGIKVIAIITMLIDHIGAFLVYPYLLGGAVTEVEKWQKLYYIMRIVGRVALPIFAFMLIEGIKHTSNVKKYVLRLVVFAIISELPFVMASENAISKISMTNVFFTLAIALTTVAVLDKLIKLKNKYLLVPAVLIIGIGAAIAKYLETDYGEYGVLAVVLGFLLSKITADVGEKISYIAAISGICMILISIGGLETFALLSIIPVCFYNGKRGAGLKYFFYVFYQAHLFVITLIRAF